MAAERGQASVELLGALPVVLLIGAVVLQLLAVGYSATLAGSAAEAGALAVAGGGDAVEAARAAVPGWSRAEMKVESRGGRVSVLLRPPSPLELVRDAVELRASAKVEAPS
jgi:pilus assembly protein CpaE